MNTSTAPVFSAITKTQIGVTSQLSIKGSLTDNESLQELLLVIDECIAKNEVKLILDFTGIQLLYSVAIDALLTLQDQLIKLGGWLKISGASPLIREIAALTRFDEYISFIDTDGRANADAAALSGLGKGARLGDILVARGLTTTARIEEALKLQDRVGKRMGRIIIDKGWVSEADVLRALSEQLGVPFARVRLGLCDPTIVELLDARVAKRLAVLPLFKVRGVVYLACAKPQDMPTLDEVSERMGCPIQPVLARKEDILKQLTESAVGDELTFDLIGEVADDFEVVAGVQNDDYATIDQVAAGSPVINMINSVIQRAVHDGASDIHFEPFRTQSRIRFRIDGLLYEFSAPRVELHPALVSRLKVMANLDISERRLPQDGRIQVHTQGRAVDLRFSSLPGLFGEKVVLRVLDKNQAILDVNKLNMAAPNLATFKELLDSSHGLILVTGPTGSGKTTSLYAALNHLKSIEKNIVTIEDPVEYQIDIINQNEVRSGIGLTFAKILKHVLRQDPDIVMVGEIRERETAEIAVQAALTGHLVLSTLHTNDAVGAVTRLIDMGIEPYLLSSALLGVVGQRLVRTVCPSCKVDYLAPPPLIEQYGWQERGDVRLSKGAGCNECYDSGFKGRMGVHEALKTDNELQQLIITNPGRDVLTQYLKKRNFRTLLDDGLERALEKRTTIEEVARVINS